MSPSHEAGPSEKKFNYCRLPLELRLHVLRLAFYAPPVKLVLFLKDWQDLYIDFQIRWSDMAHLADAALLLGNASFARDVAEAGSKALDTLSQDALKATMGKDPSGMLMTHEHLNQRETLLWVRSIETAPITVQTSRWFEQFLQNVTGIETAQPSETCPVVIIRYASEEERIAFEAKGGTYRACLCSCLCKRGSLC